MPNRVLRDWTNSDRINQVSAGAERFFTRLIMKADDFGRFYGDTRLLKANLFPLLIDTVREAEITRWINELSNTTDAEGKKAGIIALYEVNGKKYIEIDDFGQRLDRARAKFPLPPTRGEARVIAREAQAESESETKLESESEKPPKSKVNLKAVEIHGNFLEQLFSESEAAVLSSIAFQLTPRRVIGKDEGITFNASLVTSGKEHTKYTEYREHFRNWLNTKPASKQNSEPTKKQKFLD